MLDRAGVIHLVRPALWRERAVPEVLRGGNHAAIERWRQRQAVRATLEKRPDLVEGATLTPEQRDELETCKWRERKR